MPREPVGTSLTTAAAYVRETPYTFTLPSAMRPRLTCCGSQTLSKSVLGLVKMISAVRPIGRGTAAVPSEKVPFMPT